MSSTLKESDAGAKALRKRFAKNVLAMASKIADRYQVIVSHEDGCWYGRGVEMPYVFGEGKTAQACVENAREALRSAVAVMLENGDMPPMPAEEANRTEQVNVRLSALEKTVLQAQARSAGHKGLGDFLRTKAMASGKQPGKSKE
jgi:predicted RNase H-like HicB family nuclease